MFAQRSVYVNELGMIVCVSLMCWGISNTTGLPRIARHRHTYSFNAHAMEHVENILCWNIARWTLSIGAASQASYCRIHHTDPHLQRHTRETFSTSTQTSPQVKSWEQRSLFCWIVWGAGCTAVRCGRVLQLFRRTVGLCLEDEWAQYVPQYALVILFVSSNHQHHIITALFIWENIINAEQNISYVSYSPGYSCFYSTTLPLTMGIHFLANERMFFPWLDGVLLHFANNTGIVTLLLKCILISEIWSTGQFIINILLENVLFLDFSIQWYLTLHMNIHVFALCFFLPPIGNTTILGWVHWVGELEMSLNVDVTCRDRTAEFY